MTDIITMSAEQFIGEVMGSFDTASIVPGVRFFLLETAQEVGRLYALLNAAELAGVDLCPALSHRNATRWEISGALGERFTYTLTRDDYELYNARPDAVFLGALNLPFWEGDSWITG